MHKPITCISSYTPIDAFASHFIVIINVETFILSVPPEMAKEEGVSDECWLETPPEFLMWLEDAMSEIIVLGLATDFQGFGVVGEAVDDFNRILHTTYWGNKVECYD